MSRSFKFFRSFSNEVRVQWKLKNGSIRTTKSPVGTTILRAAHQNSIELEGACEGVCACSTCHVILDENQYDLFPEPSEAEEDMLDQAPGYFIGYYFRIFKIEIGLTATSRLGCQLKLDKEHDGMLIKLPTITRNFYVDGHTPKPH